MVLTIPAVFMDVYAPGLPTEIGAFLHQRAGPTGFGVALQIRYNSQLSPTYLSALLAKMDSPPDHEGPYSRYC